MFNEWNFLFPPLEFDLDETTRPRGSPEVATTYLVNSNNKLGLFNIINNITNNTNWQFDWE